MEANQIPTWRGSLRATLCVFVIALERQSALEVSEVRVKGFSKHISNGARDD